MEREYPNNTNDASNESISGSNVGRQMIIALNDRTRILRRKVNELKQENDALRRIIRSGATAQEVQAR